VGEREGDGAAVTYRVPDPKRAEEVAIEQRRRDKETADADAKMIAEMKAPLHGWRLVRGLVAFVVVGMIALPLLYVLAITVAPSRTSDAHPVMPIGQAAFALFFAPIVGLIVAFVVARRRR